jgi:hypothetical protein
MTDAEKAAIYYEVATTLAGSLNEIGGALRQLLDQGLLPVAAVDQIRPILERAGLAFTDISKKLEQAQG